MSRLIKIMELQDHIQEVRRKYKAAELRQMFRERTNDNLFFQLGRTAYPLREVNKENKHLYVWTGFELAIGFEAKA